jgi:manganese transport protein
MASDPTGMGRHVNGRLANAAGAAYLLVIVLVAVAAVPLLVITGAGNG